jgi:hypothetical protein
MAWLSTPEAKIKLQSKSVIFRRIAPFERAFCRDGNIFSRIPLAQNGVPPEDADVLTTIQITKILMRY